MLGVFRVFLALIVASDHMGIAIFGSLLFGADGTAPVAAFLIISGFYMALVLDTKYARTASGIGRFYTNRAARLAPAYWLAIALTVVLACFDGQTGIRFWTQPISQFWQAFVDFPVGTQLALLLSNIFAFGTNFLIHASITPDGTVLVGQAPPGSLPAHAFMLFPPAWTLGVELAFYAIAPLLMFRRPLLTTVSAILLCWHLPQWFLWITANATHVNYLLFCFGGMLAYFIYKILPDNPLTRGIGFTGFGLLVLVALASNHLPASHGERIYGFLWLTWAVLPFAFIASKRLIVDRWIGEASYAIYVLHFLVYKLLFFLATSWISWLYFPALMLAGAAMFWFVERPIDEYRRRIAAGERAAKERPAITKPVSSSASGEAT